MIGKLQYVVHTRLDIALVVGMGARFSENPKENHIREIKTIMRYLKCIEDYGLWYNKGGNFFLKAFTDANWVGSVNDKKSTSGGVILLGKRLVS